MIAYAGFELLPKNCVSQQKDISAMKTVAILDSGSEETGLDWSNPSIHQIDRYMSIWWIQGFLLHSEGDFYYMLKDHELQEVAPAAA
ncbi:hypothetical protein EVAR_102194_1 [Eumeta japonica]|uniref:Uncharacterized protein n=1 Tax=Eumeta variegata TaxID=151549 RepID=A0A4C1WDR6_EUMVA|nr:hypothetical protein EVAR_102194_1 [Eumeta japonica]